MHRSVKVFCSLTLSTARAHGNGYGLRGSTLEENAFANPLSVPPSSSNIDNQDPKCCRGFDRLFQGKWQNRSLMDKEGVPCPDPNDAATGLVEIGADYDDDIAADTVTGGITAAASDENARRKRKKNGEESRNETGVESPTNNSHGFVKPSSYELSEEQKEDYKEKRQEPQKKEKKRIRLNPACQTNTGRS